MKNIALVVVVVGVIISAFSISTVQGVTPLSRKASQLKMYMPRQAVIRLLGSPTWASIPGDTGEFAVAEPPIRLYLFWRNPGCTPVAVCFDQNLRVIGWDEGRAYCGEDAHLTEPSDDYSCNKPDRAKFCK